MNHSWPDWTRGTDDANAYLQPRAGMPKSYYEGYYYTCALNFEYMAAAVPLAIMEDEEAR